MEHTWGTPETQPPEVEDLHVGAAHLYLLGASIALTVAVVGIAVEYLAPGTVSRGVFSVLAVLAVAGFCAWSVKAAETRNRRDLTRILGGMCERQRVVLDQLAELTSTIEKLAAHLEAPQQGEARPRPAATCRMVAGSMYASAGAQGDTVRMRAGTVDAPTDPTRQRLERAREDGIEQGFEIGYKAQLAELGVRVLPTPRQRRLTGDS